MEGSGIVTIGISKPLPCSTVVGGEKATDHSLQGSQNLEYLTKILRLITSLHRDIMDLRLQCNGNHRRMDTNAAASTAKFNVVPKIKADFTMK